MKSNFVTKMITAAGILAVLFYFGYSVLSYLADPLATTVAYAYRSDEAVTVSGYLVREEEVLTGGAGLVYHTRDEGERVSAGGRVATLYASQEALGQALELEELEEQLEQLEFARNVASGSQQVLRLDSDIMEGIFALRASVARGELLDAGSESSSLRAMILKREYTYSGAGDEQMQQQIDALEQQIAALRATAHSGSSAVTTARSGTFSALADGYEGVLTPESLESLTPSALEGLQPAAVPENAVGKVIYGSVWYYVTAMPAAQAEEMETGEGVTLRFMSGLDREIPMTVERISDEENGKRLVVLSCEEYLSLTTLMRHQNAQIIFSSYSGIRVPTMALRVVTETVTDDEGRETQVSSTAVYCRMGRWARLKPVEVLYQGEDYYLVQPDEDALSGMAESARESRLLRSGDEVIISASDLYDGKVIDE